MLKLCLLTAAILNRDRGSLNTILEVDHLRTIDDMFAILAY